MTKYYFISYIGKRFKEESIQYFSGLIDVHPLCYIPFLNKSNYIEFQLLSYQEITKEEWDKFENQQIIYSKELRKEIVRIRKDKDEN